jgi:uncharacterized membrane protein
MMRLLKKASLVVLITGYLAAGGNHFRSPEGYINIIPQYIPLPKLMNIAAGFFEILFGLMLIFKRTRPWSARGIILMLIAFLPVHIDMVIRAPFWLGSFYVSPFVAWIRLVVLQPLLIWWAWWYANKVRV